jgi:hypothetical protein
MTLSGLTLRARWLAIAALAATAIACGGDDEAATAGTGGFGGFAGATGDPGTLDFATQTLTMIPGELRTVSLQATPPGQYLIRFALLGDARDASLDASEVQTDADGVASVRLTAPTSATTFTLRASAGSTVAQAGVSVSASGFGTLQVKPLYAGKRSVAFWVASVRTGATCAELSGKPIDDGDLKGSAPLGKIPQVSDVPVGPALAVTVRGGYSVAGCLDVAELRAGEITQVGVVVSDLPMKLSDTDLTLELGLEATAPKQWAAALEGMAARSTAAMLGGATNDVAALLTAMGDAAPQDAKPAFAAARSTQGWDSVLLGAFGDPAAKTILRDPVLAWMAKGAESLVGPDTFSGALVSAGKYPGGAVVELATVAGIPAQDAGFSLTNSDNTTWKAQPGDMVLLGTRLSFHPSRLLAALAESAAIADVPTAASAPQALATQLGCKQVAVALVAPGPEPTEIYPDCDVTCVRALCEQALVTIWQRARDVSLANPVGLSSVDITAAGDASVDDLARPTGFFGSWVGSLNVATESDSVTAPVGGPAMAFKPPPPAS